MNRTGGKTSPQVEQMATCLRSAARYRVKVSDEHYAQLERVSRKVAVPSGGMTAKNRQRLQPFGDAETVQAFLCLQDTIRQHVDRDKRAASQKAVAAQVAAAIAILLAVPVRIANIAAIDLHRHLQQQRGDVYLVIAETKNRQPINRKIPPYALEILRWYIREYRPALIRNPTDALFPGRDGRHKTSHTLAQQIKQTIFRFTGHEFNVHLFRHFAGKVFLDQQPGSYEVVRQVLGHKRIDTTTSFYLGAEVQRASALFNGVVDELRAKNRPVKAARRRRAA